MAVYYIGNYDIVDANEFQSYPPIVLALLPSCGGEVLASDTEATWSRGARTMNAIIRFPPRNPRSACTTILRTRKPSGSARTPLATSAWCW